METRLVGLPLLKANFGEGPKNEETVLGIQMTHPKNKADRERQGKLKAKKRLPGWMKDHFEMPLDEVRMRHKDTTTRCSVPGCCGNPRRKGGYVKGDEHLTTPERRRKDVDKEEISEGQKAEQDFFEDVSIYNPTRFYYTLLIIKPDAIRRGLVGPVIANLENLQYEFIEMKKGAAPHQFWETFYNEHLSKPFYEDLCIGMTEKEAVFCVLTNKDMQDKLVGMTRLIVGNADGTTPNSIRSAFLDPEDHPTYENIVHASDSYESAAREIGLLWPNGLRNGRVIL